MSRTVSISTIRNRDLVRDLLLRNRKVSQSELEFVYKMGNAAMEILHLREEGMPITTITMPETNDILWEIPDHYSADSGIPLNLWRDTLEDTATREYVAKAAASGSCKHCGGAPRFVTHRTVDGTLVGICAAHGLTEFIPHRGRDVRFDINLGELAEGKVKRMLQSDGRMEVKWDLMSDDTDNVFLEWSRDGLPSGFQVSEADYTCLFFRDRFLIMETSKIRTMIRIAKQEGRWSPNSGDGGRTAGALIPLAWLVSVA